MKYGGDARFPPNGEECNLFSRCRHCPWVRRCLPSCASLKTTGDREGSEAARPGKPQERCSTCSISAAAATTDCFSIHRPASLQTVMATATTTKFLPLHQGEPIVRPLFSERRLAGELL